MSESSKEFNEWFRKNHEAMKAWNERRARAEEEGLKRFRTLGELWRSERERQVKLKTK